MVPIRVGPKFSLTLLPSVCSNVPRHCQVGGGIRTDNAVQYLEAGASHVIVTSYVFREGKLDRQRLKELVAEVGKDNLVLDLSCRKQDGVYK